MTGRPSFIAGCAGAAAGALALLLGPLGLGAASAEVPVLTGPDSTWSTSGVIADPHVQATCAADPTAPLPVAEAVCPSFTITLDAPDTEPIHYLDVRLDFGIVAGGRTVEDYDLYVYDAAGTEVASAAHGLGTYEIAAANIIPDGTYTISVVPFTNLPNSPFTLSARLRTTAS